MDIKIDGTRIRTTSAYDARVLRALPKIEGMKKWGNNRSLSFDNTPYNIRIWKQTFPDCMILDETASGSTQEPADGVFDVVSTRPSFEYKTQPRNHQKAAIEKLMKHKSCGLFMDIGTGKSWTGIAFMGMRWCNNEIDQVLIIAKNGIHEQWIGEQFPRHMSPVVPWKSWVWKTAGKKAAREFDDLLQFDGLRVFAINTEGISTAKAEAAIFKFLDNAKGRTFIIIDESQDIKTMNSNRTVAAIRYGNLAKYKMIMTGTPIAKTVVDLYSQFYFLDPDILGFKYLTTFRNYFCDFMPSEFGPVVTGHKNIEELYNKIDPYVFRITSAEALDLPPQVFVRRKFVLSKRQYDMIDDLKRQFFAQIDEDSVVAVKNAVSLITRIQQISCGFVVSEDGVVTHLTENPRIDAMMDVIEQRGGKIVIWCRFHEDVELVMKRLGKKAVDYYGKTSEAQRAINKQLFSDPNSGVEYFVASPEAAGTGMDGLQHVCATAIYFSNSFNSLARWQSEGRIWRDGTTGTVMYFDLIAKGSPDNRILANLKDKKDIADLTLDEYRKLIESEGADEFHDMST